MARSELKVGKMKMITSSSYDDIIEWDLSQIVQNYNDHWPDRPGILYSNNWVVGTFAIGNDYRNKVSYYGAYPGNLLERYNVMFDLPRDDIKAMHVFSGAVPPGPYIRVDLMSDCDVQADAEILSVCKELEDFRPFDICFADPPYTTEDAKKYGTKNPNRLKVMSEIHKVMKQGALLIWLDTSFPMFRKAEWKLVGCIGIIRSTNHRVRGIFIFLRIG